MRFNFRFLVVALMIIGSSYAIAQVDVIDRFDGATLNSRWVTAPGLNTKAGGSYRQTNGALNFTVATGSTSRVENNIHVLNTNSLPTDRSWTLVIGMHNSADYSTQYGASQLQIGVGDMRTVNSVYGGVGFTLARSRNLNEGNPLFGFYGTNLPKWHENGGIWTNANVNASARFEYNALTRTLQGFVTTDGVNPIDNTYNYFSAGPASSIPIPATAKLNLLVIQNVYSVAVPVGKMWVDNYKLSFAPLDGRLYPGLPATLSRRPGQDLFLSVSPRDNGTFTYEWRKDGQAITPLSFGKQTYFKSDLKSSDSGTYSVVVKRNGTVYATNQTILTVTNTAPGAFGSDDFTNNSNRWSGLWGFDAHDSYLEVNGGRLDYVLDKAGSENSQAFQLWDNRLPSSQNWEVVIDTFMDSELSPERYFALRLGVAAPVNLASGLGALNGLEINFANSRYGGGKKIQNIKTIPTGDGWLELSQPALNQSTTAVALRMKWDAVTKVLTSYYDSNGATGGYVWTQSATNNLSSLPSSQLAAGFYALVSGIAEPSFLLPAGQAYFKNFQVRTGPVIPAQMAPQTAAEGGSVTFTAPGEGTGPISYQWRKNGVAIDGQTNSTLMLSGLTATDAGQYSVFIFNALGTVTSSNALLTVIVPPAFPAQATNGLRGNLGSAFRYVPTVIGSAAVFTASNFPPGLTVNRTNGLITGTPTSAGYYRSALTASNFAGTAALRLNFTIPGYPQTLPFTDDFSRTNANRYMPLGFSGISAEARAGLTNGVLRFTCISNAQAAELFPRPFGYGEEAAFGWAANLGLSVNRPWQIEANACVPESGLFGLAIYPDSLNSTVEQALPRRLNLYWHRTPTNSRGWLATSGWTVNGAGQQEEYDSPPMGYLNSGPTSSVVKLRLVMGISGTNRLLTAWGTEDLTGRGGWSQIGQTLELNPGGTTDRSHYPLGQDWNLSTNSTFSLGLFGQFGAAGQASWVDNLRVTVAVPPVITSTTNLIGQVGKASFSYSISATNSPTSFAASNLPAGLGVDSSTGLITGTPTAAGSNNVVLYASSPAGTGSRTNLAIILPEFTSATTSTGFVNDGGFSHRVAVGTNNFGSNLKYAASGLPTGMSINTTSGVISGKPTVAGTFGTRVTITAGTATAFQDIQISVYNGEGNRWAVGSPVSYQVNLGTGVTGFQASGLPTGMTINATTGLISGTPIEAGEYSVTVTVPARGLSTVIPFFIRPIYVNLAATGANNGASWSNAYTNLQTAINAAGAGAQIWVAAGTYMPTSYIDPKVTNDARSRSFLLKGGVSVLGGFAGTETQLAQRDVESNPTILSGDFNGNDSATWPPVVGNDGNVGSGDFTRSENAYHVVGALSQTTAPILDGFTITGGNANNISYRQPNNGFPIPAGTVIHGWAPGIAVVNADMVIRNCHVTKNVGKGGACAFINITGQLRRIRIADSVFEKNLAYFGNGAAFEGQVVRSQNVVSRPLLQVTVVRSAFLQNESRTGPDEDNDLYPDGGDGGAVYFYWGVEGNFVNCIFIENYANGLKANGEPWLDGSSEGREGNGGAIQARRYCDLNIANSIFAGNLCDDNGGAINMGSGVRLKMYFSTFYGNDSTNNGRGFGAGVAAGWYGPDSLRPNTMTGYGIVSWQNPPIEQEIDLWQGDWVWSPSLGRWIEPPLPPPSTLSQSVFSTATSLTNNVGTLRNGNPNFVATNNLAGADGSYLTDDDGLRIRSGSLAQNLVSSPRPNDFADLDEDGNTTELLPYDAAGVAYPANPPYNAGAYQTLAP